MASMVAISFSIATNSYAMFVTGQIAGNSVQCYNRRRLDVIMYSASNQAVNSVVLVLLNCI